MARNEKGERNPRIERADSRLVDEVKEAPDLVVEPTRDQFDYIYRSKDLIHLAGRKYHGKRNHIHKFLQTHAFTYSPLEERHLPECLELGGFWCEVRRCEEDMNLMGEWEAVRQAMTHFSELKTQGGGILLGDKVEAFSLGDMLTGRQRSFTSKRQTPKSLDFTPLSSSSSAKKPGSIFSGSTGSKTWGNPDFAGQRSHISRITSWINSGFGWSSEERNKTGRS